MELVLLFEVSEEKSMLVYSLNQNEEFIVEVLSEEANRYRDYSQADDDFIFVFDRATYPFETIEDEKE